MPPANLRQWRSIVVAFICVAAIAAGNIAYTRHLQATADQRWCDLLTTLNTVYQRTPPPTTDGRLIAAQITRQHAELGCPPPL